MNNWNEINTASCVARLGTVSAAADQLSIHRATVLRHIDLLEKEYGAKLFIRAQHGYTPTDFGLELLRVAEEARSKFSGLHRFVKSVSSNLQGELVIATHEILVQDLLPVINSFTQDHPDMSVRLLSSDRLANLAKAEADIAFRIGLKPDHPDHVVKSFISKPVGLFAGPAYVQRYGIPQDVRSFSNHIFATSSNARDQKSAFVKWIDRNAPAESIRFKFSNFTNVGRAVSAGYAIGFMPTSLATAQHGMIEVVKPLRLWTVRSWRLTHVDIHRTDKIQSFLKILAHHFP
ncbi:MAG: LysR family transcriptional regulator [Pseudomonadota bacterium]